MRKTTSSCIATLPQGAVRPSRGLHISSTSPSSSYTNRDNDQVVLIRDMAGVVLAQGDECLDDDREPR